MKCLITGGAGFIGSHLVDQLLDLNNQVTIVDNFTTGKELNLSQHHSNKNLIIFQQSIVDNVADIFDQGKFETVFHLAAIPQVEYSIHNPIETNKIHIDGALNLLDACRQFKVKRFIFTSSSAIYGDHVSLPTPETAIPNPISPYGLQKLTGEHYCRLYSLLYGLQSIVFRLFNVYGPRQNPEGDYANVIPKFIDCVNRGTNPPVRGDGQNSRDYVFISDVVSALVKAPTLKSNFIGAINLGSGQGVSLNALVRAIATTTGKAVKPNHVAAVAEPKKTLADISRAKKFLGWTPKTSFSEGLRLTYEYFSQNG